VDDLKCDLLVAVLAVLTDAIPRSRLAGVLKTWSEKCEEPLGQALQAATGLDDEQFHALECLAAAHLKTHQDDLRLSLQALGAQAITDNVLTEPADSDARTLANPASEGESTIPMDQESHGEHVLGFSLDPFLRAKASAGATGERFKLIRPHAQGGIGQVWLARDSELQREVAVKEIQPRYAGREDQRARFVLEAEITGSLEHPGIVPVYSLGRNAEGRPYYAMRFIKGESLQVAIRRFHKNFSEESGDTAATDAGPKATEKEKTDKKDPATKDADKQDPTTQDADRKDPAAQDADKKDPATKEADEKAGVRSKWGIEFRQLIGRFLDVCDAIDYAHSRGVLHRDLKPANIMLGPYGETLVVDWGLAKKIGTAEAAGPAADGDFDPPADDAAATLAEGTQQGTTIGTPAYMSPEQARGLIDQLGPASDVYSLGASLYELITGKAPFHEKKISAVIAKVIAGDFAPLRAVDRTIPAPLEAICLKAMAKKPEARYGSVRALAQDLEHWLADEPTGAYPESRVEKMTRWFRQHRAVTFAAAAALVCISFVAVVAALFIEGARHQEEVSRKEAETNFALAAAARHQEEVARKEAETNFAMAQKAVDDYLTNVSENTLLREQDSVDIRSLRRDLLKSALTYYEQFAAQRKDDPALRQQLARAHFRVGQITREIDSLEQAMGAFRSALAIWEPMVKADPGDAELAGNMAECFLAMGKLESFNGNYRVALGTLERSREILARLWQEHPAEPRYPFNLADCYSEIGIAHARLDEPDESLAIHEKATAIQQGLIERHPKNLAYKKGLAENLNAIGFAYYTRHFKRHNPEDIAAAVKTFHDVQDFCQALLKELSDGPEPTPTWLLNLLALSQYNIGSIHKQNGDLNKALPFFEESLKHRSELADQHASVTRFREKLGMSCRDIAELQHQAGQDDKAIASTRRSIDVFSQLVRTQPETASFHSALALGWNYLGVLEDDRRNNLTAIRHFDRAIREQQLAMAKNPSAVAYKQNLSNHLDNLGEQYVDLGRPDEGLAKYLEEIQILRELSRTQPDDQNATIDLVKAIFTLGTIKRHLGDASAAEQMFADARTILERSLKVKPEDNALKLQVAVALDKEADAMADRGQTGKAKELLERAAAIFREVAGRAAAGNDLALERAWRGDTLFNFRDVAGRAAPGKDLARERAWRSETLWDLGRVLRDLKQVTEAEQIEAERLELWKAGSADELVALANLHLSEATLIAFGKFLLSPQGAAVRELDLNQAANELKLAVERGCKDLGKLKSRPEWHFLQSRVDGIAAVKTLEK
jgi:eukaryotic-like serine/threonine-protein kinase